ncbi:MAG: WYL domain-containing protein [Mucilaginibacter sp.]
MNRIDRISAILIQLQSRRVVKASDIAERFNISLRTVYRDIRTLEEAGIPLIGEAGVGYSIMDGYRLPPVMFTREEAIAFLTAEKFVEKLTDANTLTNYQSAMYKVRAILKTTEKDLLEGMDNRIAVLKTPIQQNASTNNHIQTILNAIVQKSVLRIKYFAGHSQENTTRDIEPVGIFYLSSHWHLIAYCRLRDDYRDFRIDRIKTLTITDQYFEAEHPTLKQYIAQTAKEKLLETVVIVVDKAVYSHLDGQKYYSGFVAEKEIDGRIEMTFLCGSLEGFARWYIMFGDQADIIEPESLKDRVKEIAETVIKKVSSGVSAMAFKVLLIMLFFIPTLLCAQVIKGRVTDAETGTPLGNVNVYLSGTVKGTTSDSLGNFILNNVLKSDNPLVVSYVGYQSQTINNYADKNLNIALKPKIIELKEVTIGSDEISRAKAMKIFLKEFIGGESNDCIINNPDEIYFRYYKKTNLLIADADKPLSISNKRLGYKITYFLSDFRYKPFQTDYKGSYFFTEDTLGLRRAKIKKIIKARNDAYLGSRLHFIRSLWADELDKNKFSIYKTQKGITDYSKAYLLDTRNQLSYNSIVEVAEGQKFIMLKKDTAINDDKAEGNDIYILYNNTNTAFMHQADGNIGTVIDRNGFYGDNLEWKGYMGSSRVGDLLPFEFQLSKQTN